MNDTILYDALKQAIIEAFFEQKHFYDDVNRRTYTYGGLLAKVVKQVVESLPLGEIAEKATDRITEDEEVLIEQIKAAWVQHIQDKVQKFIEKSSYSYHPLTEKIERKLDQFAIEVAMEEIKNSAHFENMIREQVVSQISSHNYTLDITVKVNAVLKEEQTA
jgi:uncharacterized membrane protein YheB (UPF0754 family)